MQGRDAVVISVVNAKIKRLINHDLNPTLIITHVVDLNRIAGSDLWFI